MTRVLLLTALLLGLSGCGHLATKPAPDAPASMTATESRITPDVGSLTAIRDALAESGARRTLLVLDIDDTLLTSPTFFGSDRWYVWQSKKLPENSPDKLRCLFDVIALNYEAGTQQATEPDAGPALINGLAVDRLILTSRGSGSRPGTVRELTRAGYALERFLAMPEAAAPGDGMAYSWPDQHRQGRSVTISFGEGILMVSGQDKGRLLVDFLRNRLRRSYDRIVLVDDDLPKVVSVQTAMREAGVDFHGLHYTRIDKRYSDAEVDSARRGWAGLRAWLETAFPARLAQIEAGNCAY